MLLRKIFGWALIFLGVSLFGGGLAEEISRSGLVLDSAYLVGTFLGLSMLPACFIFLGWYLRERKRYSDREIFQSRSNRLTLFA